MTLIFLSKKLVLTRELDF